jgi:hypothetical protein
MLYLYALAAGLGNVEDLKGVQGESLIVITVDGAVAVAGDVSTRPSLDAEILKAQDRLVRDLHERAASLLPMRFGVTASDRHDVVRAIGAREGLPQRLAAVSNCEQMTARVFAPGASHAPGVTGAVRSSGTEYLQSRAKESASPDLLAIAEAARELQREVRIERALQPGLLGSVYHLIERGRADEYRAAVERAAAALPGVRVVVSGPSPPYAFA